MHIHRKKPTRWVDEIKFWQSFIAFYGLRDLDDKAIHQGKRRADITISDLLCTYFLSFRRLSHDFDCESCLLSHLFSSSSSSSRHDCFHFIWHHSIFQLPSLILSSCPSISNWINLDFCSSPDVSSIFSLERHEIIVFEVIIIPCSSVLHFALAARKKRTSSI